jgi:hypothetical protein
MEENDTNIIVNEGINRLMHNTFVCMDENVKKCSLSKNLMQGFQCECGESGSRDFFSGHLGKVGHNSIL